MDLSREVGLTNLCVGRVVEMVGLFFIVKTSQIETSASNASPLLGQSRSLSLDILSQFLEYGIPSSGKSNHYQVSGVMDTSQ